MQKAIEQLCMKSNLGALTSEPKQVSGGLLHRMYHVVSDLGEYAVKVLNPDIMNRPEALQNMINSENIADKLQGRVPLVTAKHFEGERVLEEGGTYYMVFDWQVGEAVFAPDITEHHCAQIGKILGGIHMADITVPGIERNEHSRNVYDWNLLLEKAEEQNLECCRVFKENLQDIIKWDQGVIGSWQEISQEQVISHRDLDPKNVMWNQGQACVIDWESAGYVNPFQELIEVLNYWIPDENGKYDKKKFDALIQSYAVRKDIMHVNWKAVLNSSFDGMLGWLEYSLKRALGLEGCDAKDKEEGEQQVIGTISELKGFEAQLGKLYAWMIEFMEV